LPGGIATFEQDDDPRPCFLDPILQMAKLDLQLQKLAIVNFAFHFAVGVAAVRWF
jgi:hypothetical protein